MICKKKLKKLKIIQDKILMNLNNRKLEITKDKIKKRQKGI